MATQEAALKALLTSNAIWTSQIAAANTFLWDDLPSGLGATPKSLEDAGAFDANGALEPTAVIVFGSEAPHGDIPTIAENRFFQIWMWQQQGFATIRQAKRVAKSVLSYATLNVTDYESVNTIFYGDASREFFDPGMGDRPCLYLRFELAFVRS
jgi:hypothetical protein